MTTVPAGKSVWEVQDFISLIGFREGLNRVCLGRVTVEWSTPGMETVAWYSMMDWMFSGFLEEAMMVFTPASVAISAAISFVSIPPVPRLDPSVAVLTAEQMGPKCIRCFVFFGAEDHGDFQLLSSSRRCVFASTPATGETTEQTKHVNKLKVS